jgi:hypothetical protein
MARKQDVADDQNHIIIRRAFSNLYTVCTYIKKTFRSLSRLPFNLSFERMDVSVRGPYRMLCFHDGRAGEHLKLGR